jgi:hypothetical protein
MQRGGGIAFLSLAVVVLSFTSVGKARDLTYEDRVKAQKAIEQVYWNHRIWPRENGGQKPPLEAVVPSDVITSKVTDYLRKSNALVRFWNRAISAQQLQAEVDRIVRNSRDPRMLEDLFAALGHDPTLIAECLARPVLVDRLIRGWYARDDRFHGKLKARAESELEATPALQDPERLSAERTTTRWRLRGTDSELDKPVVRGAEVTLDDAEWRTWISWLSRHFDSPYGIELTKTQDATAPAAVLASRIPVGQVSRLYEGDDAFYAVVILDKKVNSVTLLSASWS